MSIIFKLETVRSGRSKLGKQTFNMYGDEIVSILDAAKIYPETIILPHNLTLKNTSFQILFSPARNISSHSHSSLIFRDDLVPKISIVRGTRIFSPAHVNTRKRQKRYLCRPSKLFVLTSGVLSLNLIAFPGSLPECNGLPIC